MRGTLFPTGFTPFLTSRLLFREGEAQIECVKMLLKERTERMSPVSVVWSVPKAIPPADQRQYVSVSSLSAVNRLRIRNALLPMTVEAKRRQMRSLASGEVRVRDN